MKIKLIFFSFMFAAAASVTNCSGNKTNEANTESQNSAEKDTTQRATAANNGPQFQVDMNFQKQLASVLTAYLKLKDAFVASDETKVKEESAKTNDALSKADMTLLSGAAHHDWMTYLSPIQQSLKEIQETNDIEVQRKSFSILSENLYKSAKAFGLGGHEVFYEFCPMAFNNEGAYWLSDQEKIRNPYFGEKMLSCGQVKEKIK